jgi:hypothetical protein
MAEVPPAIFFGHGNPMNAVSENHYTALSQWLARMPVEIVRSSQSDGETKHRVCEGHFTSNVNADLPLWCTEPILVEPKIAWIFVCVFHYQARPLRTVGIRTP